MAGNRTSALLTHIDKNTQIAAARALGKIGDRRAIEPLAHALQHEQNETCDAMEDALRDLGVTDRIRTISASRSTAMAGRKTGRMGRNFPGWFAGWVGITLLCTLSGLLEIPYEARGYGFLDRFITNFILVGIVLGTIIFGAEGFYELFVNKPE